MIKKDYNIYEDTVDINIKIPSKVYDAMGIMTYIGGAILIGWNLDTVCRTVKNIITK